MTTRLVETSHCKIAIDQSTGSGMPILFIHGNSSCKEVFRNQLHGEIGKTFRCIAMDLPGHGMSENGKDPGRTYTMTGYADAALQVVEELDVGSFAIMGWSLGGHIGIEILAHSTKVSALLISGTPPVCKGTADMAQAFLPSEHMALTGQEVLSPEEAESYAHATCGSDAQYEDFLGQAVRRTDGRARRIMMEAAMQGAGADQRQLVETNPTPLAIVNGADDPMVNNDYIRAIDYKNLWENKVHLVPNVGHAPFWEASGEFDSLLNGFISSIEGD